MNYEKAQCPHTPTYESLCLLYTNLCRSLSALPGIQELRSYGSLAKGEGDRYSDIDLQVVTSDLDSSLDILPAALAGTAPVLLAWRIPTAGPAADAWAATFLFRDYSPYHRLDLSFTLPSQDGFLAQLPYAVVPLAPVTAEGPLSDADTLPLLEPGSNAHFLTSHLISSLRYIKAQKRDRRVSCWRYVAALANAVAATLYEQSQAWNVETGGRIGTSEYVVLDGSGDSDGCERFLANLAFGTAADMDASLYRLLAQLGGLVEAKAEVKRESLPEATINRLLAFIDRELALETGSSMEHSS